MDILAQDILAPEQFGTGIYWHFPQHLTFWHRHFGTCVTVPKCPCTETSMVPKNPCGEMSLTRERKCPCVGTAIVTKRPGDEMSLAKMLGAEMVGSFFKLV